MKPENICKTPRYQELRRLRQYYEGKQYEGRADFWSGVCRDGEEPRPLRERKPCIIYPLPKASCRQVVRFTFGEDKFPTLKVEPQEDDAYETLSLSEKEAELLQNGIVDLIENGLFKTAIRALMARGLAERTAVGVLYVKQGRFVLEMPHAQDCEPRFEGDDPNGALVEIVWVYQYSKAVEENGEVKVKKFWFRRDITTMAYRDYEAIEVKPGEKDVPWGAPKETVHGYGFVPALWIRNLDEDSDRSSIDGVSIYEDLFDEFDALNFTLSQRHRGVTFFGTPQPYETGVAPDDGPEADGRRAATPGFSRASNGELVETVKGKQSQGGVKQAARRLSPDRIWSYEGDTVKVGLIETTGKAFEVLTLHVEDIRGRLLESMSIVLASIEAFVKGGGEMNAKFLVLAYAPLLNLVGELREATWWPHGLRALLSLALRVLAKERGEGIVMPKARALAALVSRFEVEVLTTPAPGAVGEEAESTTTVWMLPKITPTWGDAFVPSNAEIGEGTLAAGSAFERGLIPQKDATSFVAPYFGIDDIDGAVAELEAKAEEEEAARLEIAKQQSDDAHTKSLEQSDDKHAKNLEIVKVKATLPKPNPGSGPKGPK